MTLARGVAKKVSYKKEPANAWGDLPTVTTGAKQLRRVTASFNKNVEFIQSAEIRVDRQISDYRGGLASAEGSLNGELSPGTYADFLAAALARDFTAGAAVTGASITIATSGDFYTLTRAAGDFLADGFYVGNIVRLAGAGFAPANVGNNLLVLSATATILTVKTLAKNTLTPEGPIASAGVAVVGKQTYAPLTGHTSDSFTFEEFYADVTQSEVYTGNKVGSVALSLPTSGFVTADFSFMGKDLEKTGTAEFFTSPTPANNEGLTVSVSGAVLVNGVPAGVITSADFTIDRGLEAANVIGSNSAVEIFDGRINVTGNMSTYFEDGTYRDYFINETAISIVIALSTGSEPDAEVISFLMPRVKLGSATRDDGESGLVSQHSFQALLNSTSGAGKPVTTMLIQDTSLV